MLLPLLDDTDAMDCFSIFISDFKNGKLPPVLKLYLLPANLLTLEKSGSTDPRPGAVGEMFYRLTTSLSLASLTKAIAAELSPIQLGIGVEGGVDTAVHYISSLLTDSSLEYAGVAVDIANAFNSSERSVMLDELFHHDSLSSVWRLAHCS